MDTVKRYYIVIIVALLTTLAYCLHILLRPSFTIISLTGNKDNPAYTHNVKICKLDTYVPQVASKTFETLSLKDLIKDDAIYKIIPLEAFDPAIIDDCVKLSSLDKQDNFIHAALGSQVTHILEKFFKDAPAILILELDQEALKNADLTIRKEQNKVDGPYFPHLYGAQKIPLASVKAITELIKKEDQWTINTLSIVVPHTLP